MCSNRLIPVLVLSLGAGCGSWPRYANLPEDDGAILAVDEPETIEVSWSDGYVGDATDGTPVVLGALVSGYGYFAEGELTGVGWDPDLVPEATADCNGETLDLAWPPYQDGGLYTGDVDWRGLEVGEDAKLCAALELVIPSELGSGFSYDFVPYLLSACDDPVEAMLGEDGAILGYDKVRAEIAWSVPVTAGQRISVSLAGVIAGETLDVAVPWRLGLSLVPLEAAACPILPESL